MSTSRSESQVHTRFGQVAGTPAYMSPEQARRRDHQRGSPFRCLCPWNHSLRDSAGRPAYSGKSGQEVMKLVLAGPPQSLRAQDSGSTRSKVALPEELIRACERAISRDKHERFATVAELGSVISDWLEGAKKREQALKVVNEGPVMEQRQHELEATSKILQAEVECALRDIPAWESESTKSIWWEKERKAQELYRAAQLLEVAAEQKLQGALTHKSDLEDTYSELAKRYRRQHQQAEWKRDVQAAKKAEVRLREHASALSEANPERLSHFAYLEGIGSVSVRTDVEAG